MRCNISFIMFFFTLNAMFSQHYFKDDLCIANFESMGIVDLKLGDSDKKVFKEFSNYTFKNEKIKGYKKYEAFLNKEFLEKKRKIRYSLVFKDGLLQHYKFFILFPITKETLFTYKDFIKIVAKKNLFIKVDDGVKYFYSYRSEICSKKILFSIVENNYQLEYSNTRFIKR